MSEALATVVGDDYVDYSIALSLPGKEQEVLAIDL
jgi:hypothetical protein